MNYWRPKTLSQRLSLQPTTTSDLLSKRQSSSSSSLYHSRPLSFVFKCQLLVTCRSLNFNSHKMAPRNLTQTIVENGNQEDCSDLAMGKSLTDFNWQKAMIQSRIMEKVQNVGDRISSQSWLEQIRTLAKERSVTSILFMMLIGLCAIPVFICMVGATFTFLGFVFVEGTILTLACCLLGGLVVVAACLALPVILVLFVTYTLSTFAFNLFSNTSTKIKQMVVTSDSPNGSIASRSPIVKSCTVDGSAFLPACITDSDSCLEETVLRRAQMNPNKKFDGYNENYLK